MLYPSTISIAWLGTLGAVERHRYLTSLDDRLRTVTIVIITKVSENARSHHG